MKRAAYPSALLIALTLAACGGSEPDTPSAADSPEATQTSEYLAQDSGQASDDPTLEPPADESMDAVPEPVDASAESNAESNSAESTVVAAATVLYVAPTGSDSNPGTSARPLKTIVKASQLATPGTTVYVAPGNYAGGFTTTKSGTASARIRYVSTVKHRAVLVAASGSTARHGWSNTGNYVDIDGFQLDGRKAPLWRNGILTRASYGSIVNNYIHHIAQSVPCDNNGGSAINSTHYYKGVQIRMENNLVHDIGAPNCKFIQGIYAGTSGTVKNNVVYRVGYAAIHLWHDAHSLQITNNTVTSSGYGIIVGGGDFYHRTVADNIHVSNNIVVNNGRGIGESGSVNSTNSFFNNLVYNNPTFNYSVKSYNTPTGTITKDPQFVNMAAGDYRLKSTSPAIGMGATTHAPPRDYRGTLRPQGARVDMGALEYLGADAR